MLMLSYCEFTLFHCVFIFAYFTDGTLKGKAVSENKNTVKKYFNIGVIGSGPEIVNLQRTVVKCLKYKNHENLYT